MLSHLDCPIRTITVVATIPSPAPCTVTDAEPVPARFNCLNLLKLPRSTEYTALRLPERSPAVITTRRVPRVPQPIKHLTDVSDRHAVVSHFELPTLPDAVRTNKPNPAPRMVTLVDPVPALFLRIWELTLCRSIENPWLALPDLSPIEITIKTVPLTELELKQRSAESDCHPVASQVVLANLNRPVKAE